MPETAHEKVLIVDFGSQVTQLIARRLREAGVYCEIHPFDKVEPMLEAFAPKAIILSGGPASVHEAHSPSAPQKVFELGVPVLGICYGEMTLCAQLGGAVEGGHDREFGRAEIRIQKESPLLEGLGDLGHTETVWMSHGDKITTLAPGLGVVGTSPNCEFAAVAGHVGACGADARARCAYAYTFAPARAATRAAPPLPLPQTASPSTACSSTPR